MNIIQQPDAFCFSSALKDIIIESDADVAVTFQAAGETFLTEAYTPDNENRIYIRDLAKLFVGYIPKTTLRANFTITLTPAGATAQTINTTVLYGMAEIDIPAADFLAGRFLTLLPEEKITYAGQREFLSLYPSEQTTVIAKAHRLSGTQETKNVVINTLNQIATVDVSPAALFNNPEQISYYVIIAGNRHFTFYVKPVLPPEYIQFLFLNAFGVKETFIPAAITTRENKYDNKFGQFSGRYRKYQAEVVKNYTANTGVLTGPMADWLEDLFLSKDVFLLTGSGIEKEIVIEESTVKRSTAPDELPAFEFKYRLSKFNQHEYSLSKNRIFDDTFDYTFD
ncbi:hypothetical protein FACS1894145_4430 [Bacteroidia bacterium]|nr:hypothetical protein FACS1894145_4430 [Bacteroidia bacterium]